MVEESNVSHVSAVNAFDPNYMGFGTHRKSEREYRWFRPVFTRCTSTKCGWMVPIHVTKFVSGHTAGNFIRFCGWQPSTSRDI